VTRLAVLVAFSVRPEACTAFERLVMDNAAASLANEPGCRQFDVLVPEKGAAGDFVLYEIYDDAAAFDAHLRSDHYRAFDQAAAPMALTKAVTRLLFAEPS
jgi:(4S)-4-hydroxy-5-phosphonooxypentane-2,3-dione isomerase